MSTALQKAAMYAPFSPEQLLLLSTMTGAAGFGGMRFINDLYQKMNPLEPDDNSIKLQLPNPHKKHEEPADMSGMASVNSMDGNAMSGIGKAAVEYTPPPSLPATPEAPPWYANSAASLIGLPLGFLGAKKIYDHYQGNQRQKEVDEAKNQYTQQLMLAQEMSKTASETPKVDMICEAMAEEFEKSAGIGGKALNIGGVALGTLGLGAGLKAVDNHLLYGSSAPSALGPSVTRGDATKVLMEHANPETLQAADNDIASRGWKSVRGLANTVTGGASSAYGDIFEGVTAAGALGTLGLLLNNHANKKAKEQKGAYPTSVTYAN